MRGPEHLVSSTKTEKDLRDCRDEMGSEVPEAGKQWSWRLRRKMSAKAGRNRKVRGKSHFGTGTDMGRRVRRRCPGRAKLLCHQNWLVHLRAPSPPPVPVPS